LKALRFVFHDYKCIKTMWASQVYSAPTLVIHAPVGKVLQESKQSDSRHSSGSFACG
jgi:hypothetical protein